MPDNLYDLRDQVFDGLELKAEIIEKQGQDLDIGEKFKVRFTVTHKFFNPKTGWYAGSVNFLDCKLKLEGTPYAKPIDANPLSISLGNLTYVGQYVQKEVEFEAISKLPNLHWREGILYDPPEAYVKARVEARFDIEEFFRFWHSKTFWTQIEAG